MNKFLKCLLTIFMIVILSGCIKNLDKLLSIETGMPVYIAEEPFKENLQHSLLNSTLLPFTKLYTLCL